MVNKNLSEWYTCTFKAVYKGYSKELENVPFMNSWPLKTGSNYMHYLLNGENETSLCRQWFVIYRCPLRQVWLYLQRKKTSNIYKCINSFNIDKITNPTLPFTVWQYLLTQHTCIYWIVLQYPLNICLWT